MSHLSYSFYILNTLFITLLEWGSNELITCLPITNPGFAGSEPIGDFMVRSIKWVPETPRDLVGNGKLSPWNDCTRLRHFNSIYLKLPESSFFKESSNTILSQNLINIYFLSTLCDTCLSWSSKESKLKRI